MRIETKEAKEILQSGKYTLVLRGKDKTITLSERGIKPLFDLCCNGEDYKGFCAADKVVGKAAAFLYVILGVSEVFATVMSERAVYILSRNGISAEYEQKADNIINRSGDGMCPMEKAVWDTDRTDTAFEIIKNELKRLNN